MSTLSEGLRRRQVFLMNFTGCTFSCHNSPQVGVEEPVPQGSPDPEENSQENPKPEDLKSLSVETFEESSSLRQSAPRGGAS